jgi:hypothetical protein
MLDSYENVITNGYHNISWLYWIYICIEMNLIKFIKTKVEGFEDTKGIIRIRKSKDRQYYDQNKKDNQRSTKDTYKTKDRVTRTPLNFKPFL